MHLCSYEVFIQYILSYCPFYVYINILYKFYNSLIFRGAHFFHVLILLIHRCALLIHGVIFSATRSSVLLRRLWAGGPWVSCLILCEVICSSKFHNHNIFQCNASTSTSTTTLGKHTDDVSFVFGMHRASRAFHRMRTCQKSRD